MIIADSADALYYQLLSKLLWHEETRVEAEPRGMPLAGETIGEHLVLRNPRLSVVSLLARGLNYQFMVAEAVWIMLGRNDTAMLGHYCKDILRFSDDGLIFYGAYGPHILGQLNHVIKTLQMDKDSRQAVLTIWRQNPAPTKDTPCTVSMQAIIRNQKLHLLVTMRSSDAWLGIPYDVFNFSLILNALAGELGVGLGELHLFLGSSHLYERNREAVTGVLAAYEQLEDTLPPPVVLQALPGWLPPAFKFWEQAARLEGRVVIPTDYEPWFSLVEVLASRTSKQPEYRGCFKKVLPCV